MLLGDFIASVTKAVGVKPCSTCEKRRRALNAAHARVRVADARLLASRMLLARATAPGVPSTRPFHAGATVHTGAVSALTHTGDTVGGAVLVTSMGGYGGALAAAGVDPQAIPLPSNMSWGQVDALAQNALGAIAGGKFDFGTIAPLVGGALALTGIGAPVAALVTGSLEALEGIKDWLSPATPQCTWTVGDVCFTNYHQPYGLGDPLWATWEGWVQSSASDPQNLLGLPTGPTAAYPWWPVVQRDQAAAQGILAGLGGTMFDSSLGVIPGGLDQMAVAGFVQAFAIAWAKNAEVAINGFKPADDYAIALSTAAAWNATHTPGNTFTFQPQGGGSADANSPVLYLNSLLNGDVDGMDRPPFIIYTGPQVAPAPYINPIDFGFGMHPLGGGNSGGDSGGAAPVVTAPTPVVAAPAQPVVNILPAAVGLAATLYFTSPIWVLWGLAATAYLSYRSASAASAATSGG